MRELQHWLNAEHSGCDSSAPNGAQKIPSTKRVLFVHEALRILVKNANQFPEHFLAGKAAIPDVTLEPATNGDPGTRVRVPSMPIPNTLTVPLSLFT
jgi:hypothetical protein